VTRVFATRVFDRWARKERILDGNLIAAVDGADSGTIDANLKGCLIKLRIARPGAGKRDGYRTILAFKSGDRAFFLYGFGKNERSNIGEEETDGFEEYGTILLALNEKSLLGLIGAGKLRELER
jgi:hypothetical protein